MQTETGNGRDRGHDRAVQHSAQHLISGIIFRLTGFNTVSMHLGDEISTIDIAAPHLSAETLFAAEETANAAIEENQPLIIHLCPPNNINDFSLRRPPPKDKETIRIIEIKNYDITPCSGEHCTSTGQIGILRILGAEKYKGMTRLSFIAGKRVLQHHRMLYENAGLVSRHLSVPLAETGNGVLTLLEKAKALEWRITEMENASAKEKASFLVKKEQAIVIECYIDETADDLLRIGKAAAKLSDSVFILASEKDLQCIALCSAKDCDIRPLLAGAFEKAQGKGGGSPSFFQGKFAEKKDLITFLDELKGIK